VFNLLHFVLSTALDDTITDSSLHIDSPTYNTLRDCSTAVCNALSKDPKTFSQQLFSKGLISADTLEEMNSQTASRRDHARKLQLDILTAVESNPKKYNEFVGILKENTRLYGDLVIVLEETYKGKIYIASP